MEAIIQFDEYLFSLINGTWHHPFLDGLLPLWRDKIFWIPLYVFFVALVVINFPKKALPFLLTIALLITASDTLSSKILKKTFKRPRPCKVEAVQDTIRLLKGCSSSYSLPSSHAVNHFALASFLVFTLGTILWWIRIPLLLWAASIAYAQVYIGVHFPIDVTVGSVIGLLIGSGFAFWYNNMLVKNRWSIFRER